MALIVGNTIAQSGPIAGNGFKHEVGINLLNISDLRRPIGRSDEMVADVHLLTGLVYKYHFERITVRTTFELYQTEIREELNSGSAYFKDDGKRTRYEFSLGLEKRLTSTKFQPFLGLSVVYAQGKLTGKQTTGGDFIPGLIVRTYTYNCLETGISSVAGLSWQIGSHFSISLEANAILGYYRQKNALEPGGANYDDRTAFTFNPIRAIYAGYCF